LIEVVRGRAQGEREDRQGAREMLREFRLAQHVRESLARRFGIGDFVLLEEGEQRHALSRMERDKIDVALLAPRADDRMRDRAPTGERRRRERLAPRGLGLTPFEHIGRVGGRLRHCELVVAQIHFNERLSRELVAVPPSPQ
jgi:hypothetical protein